ncbi:Lipoyl synthase [Geodia barretti]|nr:Lipoyl synthase [Geodia barretti]
MILGDTLHPRVPFLRVKTAKAGVRSIRRAARVAEALARMNLRYVVITSVDRDDLDDGGAGIFADTIRETRRRCPELIIEVLIPDFRGDVHALRKVVDAAPQVIGQNIETVRRLTRYARDRRSGYEQTLEVLANVKAWTPASTPRARFCLGLGETADRSARDHARPARPGRGHPHPGPVPPAHQEAPPVAEFCTRTVFATTRTGHATRLPLRCRRPHGAQFLQGGGVLR